MLLESINSPQDLKNLTGEQLNILAAEIRQRMIDVVSRTGGHLASSLGAVELAIALHYCLDAPRDKIVWDVGHQAYAHKIITGRNKIFDSLRQYGGISGFPSKEESEYDAFTTGHSSDAVSLALGLACARDYLPKEQSFRVAAVIGDGSLSGGLCFEGLNNAGHVKKDILVVLNTNEMSIAPNAGAISTYLNRLISLPIYNRFRDSFEKFVKTRLPRRGERILKLANKFEEGLKGLFIPGMLFEELGFRYFGPFDGHNIALLVSTLRNILAIKGPVMLHVVTKKGKGYLPAENDPVSFHGIGPFEVADGCHKPRDKACPSYTEIAGNKLVEIAGWRKDIITVTAAMPEGTGLYKFRDRYPERFFDVGIAESHAVSFAAGLSRQGLKPVVAIYSTFLQRAYDQIVEEVALQKLGVVFLVDRAGIVGEDGVTHQGIFDLAYLRHIPNMVLLAPKDGPELEAMLEFAVASPQPVVIRYPKGAPVSFSSLPAPVRLGAAEILRQGQDFAVLAAGSMVGPALEALELLAKSGLIGTLINSRFIKPLDVALLRQTASGVRFIFTVEEGVLSAGFGSAVQEVLDKPVVRLGLPDEFICHGSRAVLLERYGLTAGLIARRIKEVMANG